MSRVRQEKRIPPKKNQRKNEKQSKDMNRTIQLSSTQRL